jgi:hypothetical protein
MCFLFNIYSIKIELMKEVYNNFDVNLEKREQIMNENKLKMANGKKNYQPMQSIIEIATTQPTLLLVLLSVSKIISGSSSIISGSSFVISGSSSIISGSSSIISGSSSHRVSLQLEQF